MSLLSPQLQAFVAIANLKTVHGAAEQICLTQTAVTQRIRSLERQLNTTLFIRTRRGMQLTSEGESLLRYCQANQALERETLAAIQGAGVDAEIEITISAPTSIMHSRIIPACLPVMQAYPNLLIHFDVDDTDSHHHKLRAAKADFAIISNDQLTAEMQCQQLAHEAYILVASSQWRARKLEDIIQNERIVDFDPTDQATFNYLKHYNLFDLAQHSRYFVNRTDNLAMLVAEGMAYTTLAKEFAMPYVQSEQLAMLNQGQSYNVAPILAWFDRPEPPAYFKAVLEALGSS